MTTFRWLGNSDTRNRWLCRILGHQPIPVTYSLFEGWLHQTLCKRCADILDGDPS